MPHADPDVDTVRAQVQLFKERVEEVLAEQPEEDDEEDSTHGEASTAKLFEEIKVMFQDLPTRLERAAMADRSGPRSRHLRRLHPAMIEELIMMTSRGEPRPGLAAIIVASFLRDDLPWLYEIAAEAYRASVQGDREAENRLVGDFMRVWEMTIRGPLGEFVSSRESHMLLHELPRVLERFVGRGEVLRGGEPEIEE